MNTKIKICGLRREEDVDYINSVKPEFAGFICSKGFRRSVTQDTVKELISKLDSSIVPVGVFVDESQEEIINFVHNTGLQMVQLHGSEDNEYIIKLKQKLLIPIIKAFIVKNKNDIINAESSSADYILLDSGQGSGKEIGTELLNTLNNIQRAYFLAGGLSAETVKEKLSLLSPYAVDASSGLETDGYKDINKIQSFVNNIRLNN